MGRERQSTFPLGSLLVATTAFLGGVVMGLLLAPRSGRETLQYLGEQGEELERRIRRAGEQVAEQIQESVQQVVEQVVPPVETNNEARLSERDVEEELERIPKKKS